MASDPTPNPAYATRGDVYKYGLARGALSSSARIIASSSVQADSLELEAHGFETGDEIRFRPLEGGTLPAPLVEHQAYFAVRVTDAVFRVAATPGGAPIDLTTTGDGIAVSTPLPIDEVLLFYSRFADGFFPAHAVPLKGPPYPILVTAIVAELSAKKLQNLAGQSSASVDEAERAAKAQLERFAKGIPLRDASVTTSTNRAVVASLGAGLDPRGWGSRRLP